MSSPIKISQLVTMSLASLSDADFLPIVDIGSMATQRVTVETLGKNFRSGSYTGSAQFPDSVSFQGTASYARGALSSSYALTASIAELANNVGGLYTRIYVDPNHGFKVGHVIRKLKASEIGGSNGYSTCSIIQDLSGSEALGLVVDSGSALSTVGVPSEYIRVCYQGIADFSDDGNFTASYLSSGLITGSVYFLGTTGSLILTEPSDIGSISKPMLIALTTSSGLIINSRGIKIGTNATTSSLPASNYATTPFTTSLNRIPSYLRTTLICTSAQGDAGFVNLDELDSTSIFSTSIAAPFSSPFLTIKTSATAYTASFKTLASGWTTGSVYSASVIRHLDLSKWTFKIYS